MIEIPPPYVMRAAREALAKSHNFEEYVSILSLYYQVSRPNGPLIDKERCERQGPNTIACYSPETKTIYSLTSTISQDTVLHEFYHYLSHIKNAGIHRNYGKKEMDAEQALAYAFSSTCMQVT